MASSERVAGMDSARKALELLLMFHDERTEASVPEMAAFLGLPRSTVYRYTALLREVGLLEPGGRGRYHVSARIHAVARAADAAGGLILRARPVIQRLALESGETVVLIRLLGNAAVAVDQAETDRSVRLAYALGRTMPLTAGAPAKMLLASLPAASRSAYLDRIGAQDPEFAARRPAHEAELVRVRRRGWAESFHEVDAGMWGVAAPVYSAGRVIVAVSVAGPLSRLDTPEKRARVIERTRDAAGELTAVLDG